jgi:hypothetical protein
MVNGCLNQRATAEIINLARQDLLAGGTRRPDRKVRENAKNGVIGRVEQRIKALRTTLSSG